MWRKPQPSLCLQFATANPSKKLKKAANQVEAKKIRLKVKAKYTTAYFRLKS